jgi:hypothetical protein
LLLKANELWYHSVVDVELETATFFLMRLCRVADPGLSPTLVRLIFRDKIALTASDSDPPQFNGKVLRGKSAMDPTAASARVTSSCVILLLRVGVKRRDRIGKQPALR